MTPQSRACGLKSGSQREACPAVLRRPLRARAEQPTAISRPMHEEDAVPNDGTWTPSPGRQNTRIGDKGDGPGGQYAERDEPVTGQIPRDRTYTERPTSSNLQTQEGQ